jgi:very-short-patch-repair endonuclease
MVAERQGGAISTGQLRAVGFGTGAIKLRLRRGRLHPVHRGVYAWGHPHLTWRGRLWAAVLATGGVLSHRSAAAVWDLRPAPRANEVTTLRAGHSRHGITVHRIRLDPSEITRTDDDLPITKPMRTLLDLATTLTPFYLERAVHRAAELRLLDASLVPSQRRGARRLRTALQSLEHHKPQLTRSELEERFLKLVFDHDLPRPLTNVRVNGHTVDAYWPHARLIVELDSHEWHLNPQAFETDRRRDIDHVTAGDRVIRLTARRLTPTTARRLQALLAP